MPYIDRLKTIFSAMYDPARDVTDVIEEFLHPDYTQCINGVTMARPEYINHVMAQRQTMRIDHIEYVHHLEHGEELFALYVPKGRTPDGAAIEAEVVGYFHFKDTQLIHIHGQVRLIKGMPSDVDMEH